jgi:hypothetical protein
MRLFVYACTIVLLSGFAAAADTQLPHPDQQTQQTRIETDQKTGAVKIIVDNREVARFDARGLHVRKDLEYGGIVSDTGEAGYVTQTNPSPPR